MTAHLPQKAINGVMYAARTLDRSFHSYIVGQCTEAVILGGLCMLGMLILRLPYAAMIGALVGVTALIPAAVYQLLKDNVKRKKEKAAALAPENPGRAEAGEKQA